MQKKIGALVSAVAAPGPDALAIAATGAIASYALTAYSYAEWLDTTPDATNVSRTLDSASPPAEVALYREHHHHHHNRNRYYWYCEQEPAP